MPGKVGGQEVRLAKVTCCSYGEQPHLRGLDMECRSWGGKQKAFTNFFVKAVSSFLERETGFEPATFSLGILNYSVFAHFTCVPKVSQCIIIKLK